MQGETGFDPMQLTYHNKLLKHLTRSKTHVPIDTTLPLYI